MLYLILAAFLIKQPVFVPIVFFSLPNSYRFLLIIFRLLLVYNLIFRLYSEKKYHISIFRFTLALFPLQYS